MTVSLFNGTVSPIGELNSLGFSICNGLGSAVCTAPAITGNAVPSLTAGAATDLSVGQRSLDQEIDSDGDGLSDRVERDFRTNPFDVDSDADGYPDGLEAELGSDPLDPNKTPVIRPPSETLSPTISVQNLALFAARPGRYNRPTKGDSYVVSIRAGGRPQSAKR